MDLTKAIVVFFIMLVLTWAGYAIYNHEPCNPLLGQTRQRKGVGEVLVMVPPQLPDGR